MELNYKTLLHLYLARFTKRGLTCTSDLITLKKHKFILRVSYQDDIFSHISAMISESWPLPHFKAVGVTQSKLYILNVENWMHV